MRAWMAAAMAAVSVVALGSAAMAAAADRRADGARSARRKA